MLFVGKVRSDDGAADEFEAATGEDALFEPKVVLDDAFTEETEFVFMEEVCRAEFGQEVRV